MRGSCFCACVQPKREEDELIWTHPRACDEAPPRPGPPSRVWLTKSESGSFASFFLKVCGEEAWWPR